MNIQNNTKLEVILVRPHQDQDNSHIDFAISQLSQLTNLQNLTKQNLGILDSPQENKNEFQKNYQKNEKIFNEFISNNTNKACFKTLNSYEELINSIRNFQPGEKIADLIIFDLNFRDLNETEELLRLIKSQQALKHIPLIALVNVTDRDYIRKLYQNHVSCCIMKSTKSTEFKNMLNSLQEFWFSMVKLPIGVM